MKAILLAAGLGTRLRPITNLIPKCLVSIHGKALLQIWIEKLTHLGVESVLINTHYLSEIVESFILKGGYSNYVELRHEDILLGTAGTLIKNINFMDGQDGMLIHADNYCLDSLEGLVKAHNCRPDNCDITMLVFNTDNPSGCGIVEINEQKIVKAFYEKIEDPPGNIANGAIYILSNKALKEISNSYLNATEFTVDILPHFIGRIYTYATYNEFIDVGTIENLERAQRVRF